MYSHLGLSKVSREEAKRLWEQDLLAGYHPAEAKERVQHFAETGIALPDPTAKYWDSLVHTESRGDQSAVSPKGATGIAQVMPATGPEAAALAGEEWDPIAFKKDPVYNAKLGRAYFRKQMKDNGGDPAKALAAYNAGPGALRKAKGDISKLPQETQNYVPNIMNRADASTQPDLDDPAEVALAREALMTPRDKARKVYEDVLASGGSPEDAKAAAMQAAPSKAAPTAQGPAAQPNQAGPNGVTGSYAEPTFASKLQDDIENVYQTDPVTAGMGRSFAGTIQGVRKLYNQATGDEAKVKELEGDEQRSRDFWQKVDPQGSGFSQGDLGRLAGDVSTFAGVPAAKAGALGNILQGAAIGGVQGAVQPTTATDSQALNAGMGAGFGGAVGALGSAVRGVAGTEDPTRLAAAQGLRAKGVEVPVGQEYNSPMGAALRKMGGEKGANTIPEKSLTSTLAKQMGMEGDITNSSLEANLRKVGGDIGDLSKGKTVELDKEFGRKIIDIGGKYHMSGPVSKGDKVIAMADHLLELARPGRSISGEEYQALRTGLSANSITGSAAEKQAMSGMKRALDDVFNKQNPSPERGTLNSQYRLSQILRKGSGMPAEGMTAKQMRNKIEGAAAKGEVNPQVRELLSETNQIIPRTAIGGDAAAGAGDDAVIRGMDRPGIVSGVMALMRGVAGPASKGFDKGTIQKLINNPTARVSLANLLRGGVIPQAARLEQGEQ